jgi:hypothetical protein
MQMQLFIFILYLVEGTFYSSDNRQLPLKLKSAPAFLHSSKEYLLYVDCIGTVSVWNVPERKQAYPSVSMAPLLDQSISSVQLARGNNILVKARSKSFIYNHDLGAWVSLWHPDNAARIPKTDDVEVISSRYSFLVVF